MENQVIRPRDCIYGSCTDVEEYQKLHCIGEGTYGKVYAAKLRKSNNMQYFALKRIILHHEGIDGFPQTSLREVSCLRLCSNNKYIVKLLEIAVSRKRDGVFLVFEYCEHDLAAITSKYKNPFKLSEIKTLVYQLTSAVKHLHNNWIIHRDIKLSNLLYNNRGQLKLADFGLARKCGMPADPMTAIVVTLWYRAPELLLGQNSNYTFAIDMWSIGSILGELLLHRPLVPGENEVDQIQKIFQLLGAPSSKLWPIIDSFPLIASGKINLKLAQEKYKYNDLAYIIPNLTSDCENLLLNLLVYNPESRMSAREVLHHKYFSSSPYPTEDDYMPTFPDSHNISSS